MIGSTRPDATVSVSFEVNDGDWTGEVEARRIEIGREHRPSPDTHRRVVRRFDRPRRPGGVGSLVCRPGCNIEIRSRTGSRLMAAESFFIGMFETVLEPEDLVIGATFSPPPDPSFAAFEEVSIRPGDFALVSVLAAGHPDESGIFRWIRLAVGAVESRPRRFLEAEDLLIGTSLTADVIEEAARTVAAAVVPLAEDEADLRVRRHLVSSLVRQTLGDIRTQAAAAADTA